MMQQQKQQQKQQHKEACMHKCMLREEELKQQHSTNVPGITWYHYYQVQVLIIPAGMSYQVYCQITAGGPSE